ncbi:shikimate O-hydroxycinnamoyltransferase [Cannabis sativa]|uniref:shikimate O-hydroxycinnamoyltransferase n=1 Tax=Cannabis sativa TaxID=3483 RepID=UPI0029C9BCCB|nr:shikimate O-hydroxycinnamoyltransferase [Cannabis sativa]
MMIIIKEKERSMVKPSENTPRRRLWLSVLDQMNNPSHNPVIYFFRSSPSNNNNNFFDANILKHSLSKVLVPFYPIAGRLRPVQVHGGGRGPHPRTEIDCNEEGVLFVTAETTAVIDDFGDFAPTPQLRRLTPTVDYSLGISSYPLLLIQVTYFKCGGVSIGFGFDHHTVDGTSSFHFIESWSRITRGLEMTILPFLDRTLLKPRNPPNPTFNHIEYHNNNHQDKNSTTTDTSNNLSNAPKVSTLKITKEQLNTLKAKAEEKDSTTNNNNNMMMIKASSYVTLSAHIWKCVCLARDSDNNKISTLFLPVNGRFSRRLLQPKIPVGYFGKVIFATVAVAKVSDLKTKPLSYAVNCINGSVKRMDNDYLLSSIDYLELHPNLSSIRRGAQTYRNPNLGITSWVRLINYEVDFGWGQPIYIGPGGIMYEGKSYVIPCPTNDGSLLVGIALQPQHMKMFEKLFYQNLNIIRSTL